MRRFIALITILLLAGACGSPEPAPADDPSPAATPTTATPSDEPTSSAAAPQVTGQATVSFGELNLTGEVTHCAFDDEAEAPDDGSPLTTLTVTATAVGPDGMHWEIQLVRTLSGSSIIDVVRVYPDAPPPVDQYEAQRVVDTANQSVDDQWGDSTNALLIPTVNGDELTVSPPDVVTFGVFPAEGDPTIAGEGTITVTCSPVAR